MITNNQRSLILYLEKYPLATYSEMAKIFKATPPTIKKRIEDLHSSELNDGIILGVSADLFPSALELEHHTYFVDIHNLRKNHSMEILQELGDLHPYTIYQNRYFGGTNGVMFQFFLPKRCAGYVSQLFQESAEYANIKSIEHFPPPPVSIETYPDISCWGDGKWQFDFDEWFAKHEAGSSLNFETPTIASSLQKIKIEHLIILRELMISARRPQSEIMKSIIQNSLYSDQEKSFFKKSNQRKISRRFDFILRNKIIQNYKLLYNQDKFQIFNLMLFTGNINRKEMNQVLENINQNPLPFRSSLKYYPDTNLFYWWLNLPPNQASDFMNFAFNFSNEIQLKMLDTSLYHATSYPIWHRNLVFAEKKYWQADSENMINDVINGLSKK